MRSWKTLLIAAPIAMGLLAAPAAEAHWRGDGWRGGHDWHHHDDGGAVAGAIIGLGVGAMIGAIAASQQPHYAPQAYAPPPPAYYAPGYAQY